MRLAALRAALPGHSSVMPPGRALAGACLLPALVAAAAGCSLLFPGQAPQQSQNVAPGTLDVENLGVIALEGKSKLVGSARVPDLRTGRTVQAQRIGSVPAANARVAVLDARLQPTGVEATADEDGQFLLDLVPKDQSVILKVTTAIDGREASLRKVTRSESDLNCVKVDLASTMVADKILSTAGASLFRKDDTALQNAPLLELFKPAELDKLEETIRTRLTVESDEDRKLIAEILTQPGPAPGSGGGTKTHELLPAARLFDELARAAPELAETYHEQVFIRAESELRFAIRATGVVRNKKKQSLELKGTYHLRFGQVKPGTRAIELWFAHPILQKIGHGDASNNFTIPINTFLYPDGEYTLRTILILDSGRNKPLGSADVGIDNSFPNHCK